MDDPLLLLSRRPAVQILVCRADPRSLQSILWGLEEEGIPAEVGDRPEGDAVGLAHQAAHMSSLNVGIAVCGADDVVVLHHRDLAADRPLFVVGRQSAGRPGDFRNIGKNAARLVKGDPMVFEVEADGGAIVEPAAPAPASDALDGIVFEILRRLGKR